MSLRLPSCSNFDFNILNASAHDLQVLEFFVVPLRCFYIEVDWLSASIDARLQHWCAKPGVFASNKS